jgi:hypothetical protein
MTAKIVRDLLTGPVQAASLASSPVSPGFYSWWCRTRSLVDADPAIPLELRPPIPSDWSLLYVGISPARPGVHRTLADRVGKDHATGNVGGSTFRLSIAALVLKHLGLEPRVGSSRARLLSEAPLSQWINESCGVTFAQDDAPWVSEVEVIASLKPPLNLSPGSHPFASEVSARRSVLRRQCGV